MTSPDSAVPAAVGRFTLHERLGEGGMGEVCFGESPAGQLAAVKVIKDAIEGQDARERFALEVQSMKTVYGPHVAGLIDADPWADVPWLAMAFVPGRSLNTHVGEVGALPLELTASLGALLAEGLRSIHQAGLLHRDLKPANIMLSGDGPKIIDFGLATLAERRVKLTQTGVPVGTPVCMAPEQVHGESVPTTAVDVHALAACLLFALTGHYPYSASTQYQLLYKVGQPDVAPDLGAAPPQVRPLLADMQAHQPDDRPNLAEVTDRLLELVAAGGRTPGQARHALIKHTAHDVTAPEPTYPAHPADHGAPEPTGGDAGVAPAPSEGADHPYRSAQATLPLDESEPAQATLPLGTDSPAAPTRVADGPTSDVSASPRPRGDSAAGARRVAARLRRTYARDTKL